jgi:ribose/xylose/arabinose/galactoside ABC-type transport system permease subunit
MSAIETQDAHRGVPSSPAVNLRFRFSPRYRVVWIGLALLMLLALLTAESVYKTDSMTLITALAGVLAIASAGQLLVIMSGGIDLTVPSVMTMSAAIIVHQTDSIDGRLTGAILVAMVVCGAIGLVNGFLVAVVRLNAMIVTLAMNGVVTGVMLLWLTTSFSDSGQVPGNLVTLTSNNLGFLSFVAVIALALLALLAVVLRSTRLGRFFVAAGTNRVAAEIIGVRVTRYEMGGYVVAALLYGVAGILLAGLLQTPDVTLGDAYQLTTIIAVALGGAALAGGPASLLCTAGGCFFVALLQQYLQIRGVSGGVSQVVNGSVLILSVALVTVGAGGRFRLLRWRRALRRSDS